jgi:hypothetical protein
VPIGLKGSIARILPQMNMETVKLAEPQALIHRHPLGLFAAQQTKSGNPQCKSWLLQHVADNFRDAELATRQAKFYAVSSGADA